MNVTKKTVVALSAVGLLVLVLNLVSNRPAPPSYGRAVQDESQLVSVSAPLGFRFCVSLMAQRKRLPGS